MPHVQQSPPTPLTPAEKRLLEARYAAPTAADTDRVFRHILGEEGINYKEVTGATGIKYEVTEREGERTLTIRRPVEFPAILAGPITDEMRRGFLASKAVSPAPYFPNLTLEAGEFYPVRRIAQPGLTLAEGSDTDLLLARASREIGYGTRFNLEVPPVDVWIEKNGRGFKVRTSVDLKTGEDTPGVYFISRKGRPIDPDSHQGTDNSPVDLLIPSTQTKLDQLIWIKGPDGRWHQDAHVDLTLARSIRKPPASHFGFEDGVRALMSAVQLETDAVALAKSALETERAIEQRELEQANNPMAGVSISFPRPEEI